MNKIKIFLTIIVLSTILAMISIKGFGLWINNPDKRIYQLMGIDLSHHQGQIDWNKFKNENIDFVYLKSTEGGDYIDSMYSENTKKINEIGIPVGAYHFFTLCTKGVIQANNFINTVDKNKITLAPVVDLEFPGNCKNRPSLEEFTKELNDFIIVVEKYFNKELILYTNNDFYNKYLKENYKGKLFWYRNIFTSPADFKSKAVIWQFSEFGKIDGISGSVDLNVIKKEDWNSVSIERK
ncbi:GH25 family lysozyme [Leptospira mtsangambouensis]|uniref:GH25 family lysozyme n=1 Tax=Leptospira mtsangambouensis TaxID=2484912 RepID=UPI001EE9C11D|nr:GH25 family lysozyme [Leptospira mtsangambouensis]MCG6142695.1 lysozyme [Leptospira mtsangambouensis]